MVLSTRSKTFQDAVTDVESKIEAGEITTNQDLRSYLDVKEIDYNDFVQTNNEFVGAQEAGEDDFVARTSVPGRIVGRAVGDTFEGLKVAGEMIAPEFIENAFGAAAEAVGEYIPEDIKVAASEMFDPYHGEGTGAGIEEVVGTIGSYIVPGMAGVKVLNAAGKGAKAVRAASPGARAVTNKIARKVGQEGRKRAKKVVGVVTPAVGFAGGATVVEKPEENLVNTMIEQFPESEQYLSRLAIDPNDSEAKQYTQAFINNLGLEAIATPIALGAFIAAKATAKGTGKVIGKAVPQSIKQNWTANLGTDDITGGLLVERGQAQEAAMVRATALADELENAVSKEYKNKATSPKLISKMNKALEGDEKSFAGLKPKTQTLLKEMRVSLDELGADVLKGTKGKFSGSIKANLPGEEKKLGTYITKTYDFFDDPRYKKDVLKKYSEFRQNIAGSEATPFADAISAVQKQYDIDAEEATTYLDKLLGHGIYAKEGGNDGVLRDIIGTLTKRSQGLNTTKTGKARTDIPDEVKNLLGEVSDPFRNYVKTFTNLAKINAETKFMDEIADNLVKSGIAKTGKPVDGLNYYEMKDLARNRLSNIVGQNTVDEGIINPLENIWVTKEYRDALQQGYDAVDISSPAMKTWMKAKGLSQAAKTVYSPVTHGRNVMGNFFFLGANGMLGPKGSLNALKSITSNLRGLKNREFRDKYARYVELGIANSGVNLGVMRNNLRAFDKAPDKWLAKSGRSAKEFTKDGFKGLDRTVKDLYQAEDDLFKIMHFEKSLDLVKKSKKYRDLPIEQQERIAAQRTRDLMPNYNLVPKAIKGLRGSVVSDFVSFPAELIRVSKNLAKYSMDDLATGDAALMGSAAKRLGGMTAIGLAGDMASDFTKNIHGITAEQEFEMDNVDAPWQARTDKLYLSGIEKDKNGKYGVDVFNLGYIDPFSYVKTFAKAAHQGIAKNEELTETELQKLAFGALTQAVSPFIAPSMLTEGLIEGYGVVTSSGDTALDKTLDATKSVVGVFTPGFVDFILKNREYEKSKEKWGEVGELPRKKSGATWAGGEVDMPAFFGLKRSRQDLSSGQAWALKDGLKNAAQAGNNLTRELNTNFNLTDDDKEAVLKDYIKAQDKKIGAYKELHSLVDSYKTLYGDNFVDAFYNETRKLKGVDKKNIDNVINNVYEPFVFKPSTKVLKETRPGIPYEQFINIDRSLRGTSIEQPKKKDD